MRAFVRKSIEAARLATYHARAIYRDSRDFSRITLRFSGYLSTEERGLSTWTSSARRGDATRPIRVSRLLGNKRGLASIPGHEIGISNPTPAIGRFHQRLRAATTSRAQAGSDRRIGHVAPCGSALE